MIIKKIFSDHVPLVYSLLHLRQGDSDFLIAASEKENGSAYAYDLNKSCEKQEVWHSIGGTMTMVQIPGCMDFLATQRFYPGFDSANCELVKLSFDGKCWNQTKVMDFPYLHRFDLIEVNQRIYFIGATITEKKEFMEDWRTPGCIYVGEYDRKMNQILQLQTLSESLTKNHGYCAFKEKGYSLITAEEGVFQLNYPTAKNDWVLKKVYNSPVSDIAAIDTNQDGEFDYYLVINQFHGQTLTLLDRTFQAVQEIKGYFPFAHSIWGGNFNGRPCFIFGNREGQQNYFVITVAEKAGQTEAEFIQMDAHVGSTNTLVFHKNQQDYIVSANREIDQVAIYAEV